MSNLFKNLVKLNEEQYKQLKKNGTITVGNITIEFDERTLYVTDYYVDKILDINSENPISNSAIAKAFDDKLSNVVTLDTVQNIREEKNFECDIKKYGVNLATVNDIPKIIDSLDSNTSTSCLSANQGKILNDKISSLIYNSNKAQTFVFENLNELLNSFNCDMTNFEYLGNYTVGKNVITYKGKEYTLKTGDIFLIVDVSVPDYWFSNEDKSLFILKKEKIDLESYVLKEELPTKLPASDVYSWAKEPNKPNYDFNEIKNIPNWIKSSTKPSYTAEEVGALTELPNNIVYSDTLQTIDGLKIFSKGIESGKSTISNKTGFLNIRLSNDNNVFQSEFYVDDKGNTKITHRNRTLNSNEDDSYILFNRNEIKYVTSNSDGMRANKEYDILTTKNAYKKDEIDAKLEEIRKLIKEQ